jgi:hypothetical protein
MAFDRLSPQSRIALVRLYNGYVVHKRSFQALIDRGFAVWHNGTEQRITEAGILELDLTD